MSSITVKSVASNRVRLKSDFFKSKKNIELIKKEFDNTFISFRENIKCKSIVFTHNQDIDLQKIIIKLENLFSLTKTTFSKTPFTSSIPAANAVCGVDSSCNRCEHKVQDKKSFRSKLIEFGLLSLYAGYLFVKEHILGLAVVATPLSLVAVVSVVAAIPLLKESYEDIKRGKFTLQSFMSGTLLLAIVFGEATAAFEIIYILRGGMLLEEYIATKSKNEIHKLVELDIEKAYVLIDGVEVEVDISDISTNDIVVCRNGDKIPVDGIVSDGEASLNEALINGRSNASLKQKGDKVFAGTLCQSGRVYIKVSAIGKSTYISRVMSDVENSLALKSPAELEADRLAARLLKLGTFLTAGTFLLTGSLINAFSVMIVMSCPCATVLAASTAISAGVANGAKQGILIKGGEALEKVSQSEVFCFDKTGTLTTGEPVVIDMKVNNISKKEFLEYVSMVEYRNSHPIAKAIIKYAKQNSIDIKQDGKSEVLIGLGIKCVYDSQVILVGNKKLLQNYKISVKEFEKQTNTHLNNGNSVVYVAVDKELLGYLVLEHEVRLGTKKMIDDLRNKGVKHIALLTGDEEKVANSFALDFGFDTVYANQSPYDKANAIEDLKSQYKNVVMVGDGVNDTLAMSKADIAISFAAGGSKAAIEVSDIAVTHSHPEDVVNLYELSCKTLDVVNQNYWLGTSTNLGGVAFASVGMLSPVAAGAIHIGHTVGIMANSSRLALSKTNDTNS